MSSHTRERRAVWFKLSAVAFGTVVAAGAVSGIAWGYLHFKIQAREDSFETTWDFDNAIALDKNLFTETGMFGRTKYRYRAGSGVLNAVVWTGLRHQSLVVGATEDVRRILGDCEVQRATFFETDARGFKPTPGSGQGLGPTILMLGDAFTERLYVKPEETFVTRFADKLTGAGLTGKPQNLGVNGFSALEMTWMVEAFAFELDAAVVVANLFPNDVHARYNDVVQGRGAGEHAD